MSGLRNCRWKLNTGSWNIFVSNRSKQKFLENPWKIPWNVSFGSILFSKPIITKADRRQFFKFFWFVFMKSFIEISWKWFFFWWILNFSMNSQNGLFQKIGRLKKDINHLILGYFEQLTRKTVYKGAIKKCKNQPRSEIETVF